MHRFLLMRSEGERAIPLPVVDDAAGQEFRVAVVGASAEGRFGRAVVSLDVAGGFDRHQFVAELPCLAV
jgi:hypothetical protein